MQNILITIKDSSKYHFLLELLNQFQFVEVVKPLKNNKIQKKHSILDSIGIWKDREISAEKLRKDAWGI